MKQLIAPVLIAALVGAGCNSNASHSSYRPGSELAKHEAQMKEQLSLSRPRTDDSDDASGWVALALIPVGLVAGGVAYLGEKISTASGDTPARAARQMFDGSSPDARRRGMTRLLEFNFAKGAPYTKGYENLAKLDPDPTVRAAALRACNRCRDVNAKPIFLSALSDKNDQIRLEGAKALVNIPDPDNATPALTALASNADEDRDIRIAAIDALKHSRVTSVARVLSTLLTDRDFSISWQARASLISMTHQDFGYDQGAWLGYFASGKYR